MSIAVSTQKLSVSQADKPLIKDLNLEIKQGSISCILGRNGIGKSTLLHTIGGLHQDFNGDIHIQGKSLATYSEQQLATIRGFLPQQVRLPFSLTVKEVIQLGHLSQSQSKQQLKQAFDEIVTFTELSPLLERRYENLSGGEQQRVQLARVFLQIWNIPANDDTPKLLLLDEFCAHLDLYYQHLLFNQIKALPANITTITILHDPNLALHFADQTLLLIDENNHLVGPTLDIVTEANLLRSHHVHTQYIKIEKHQYINAYKIADK